MNRIDRISAILIQLQSRKLVRAEDIADRFGISLRTVYRDIKAILEAGVPLIGEAGKGYSIMDGYRLPPVQFTTEEATAFITAEKLIGKLTDSAIDNHYQSAMYKIRSVMRSEEKDYLETIENAIEVKESRYLPSNMSSGNNLDVLLKSIHGKNQVEITYFATSTQKETQRIIEPIGIVFQGGYWTVIAYCQLRKDYRTFRVDRISAIQRKAKTQESLHPALDNFLQKLTKEKELTEVVMEVDKDFLSYLGDQKYYNGFVSQEIKEDKAILTFLTSSLVGFSRWYIMIGDIARIIKPQKVKDMAKKVIEKTLENLQ